MARPDLHEGMSRVRELRERMAKAKARQASSHPPPPAESKASKAADATGPCAGVLPDNDLATLDALAQLEVHLGPATDSNLYTGFSQEIARGGVLICTHEHPELMHEFGRRVAVTLRFPGGSHTRALGAVRFARSEMDAITGSPPGIGIQFLSLTESGHELIHRFAAHREPIFYCD